MNLLERRREIIANLGSHTNEIPYIRGGSDGSYVDTGIKADNTVKIIVWARNFNPGSGLLFGSREATTTNTFCMGAFGDQNNGRIRVDFSQGQIQSSDNFKELSNYHKYEFYDNVCKVDDTAIISGGTATFSNNLNIHLFGCNTNGTHTSTSYFIDISACQIYKNGILVRDFNAVQGGLYDAVSDSTFTNAGSGSFTYGTFNPNAYQPLLYVECTNQQFFDTGVYPTGPMTIVSKFKLTGSSSGYPNLFGTIRADTPDYFMLQFSNTTYPNRYANFYVGSNSANQIYSTNNPRLTNRELVFVKNSGNCRLYENHTAIGVQKSFTATTFVCSETIILCSARNAGTVSTGNALTGYVYYARFGDERNYVPAKVNNMVGMYDTYNDKFYTSESGTEFVAGPAI